MQPFHQTRLGDYLLTEHLARGGMADVYRARRVGPAGFERTVVIKRIRDIYYEEPAFVKMFINEAKLASRLSHPNIAQVYELGELEGDLFIVMEYVRGFDLHQVIRALKAPVPPGVAAFVAREVCRGLAHAHSQVDGNGAPAPIIHRDIAPNNIVISMDGQVKIVDFGIAKALDSQRDVTAIGALKGRFGYMAPEQSEGAATPQSDLFSTGVILHEMLTRRRLFKGSDDLDTLTKMRHMPITPPSEVEAGVPAELDAVVLRALSRDPAARHPTASAMAKDLEGFLQRAGFSVEDMAEFMAARFPAQPLPAERGDEAEASPSPVIAIDDSGVSSSSLHPGVVIHPRPAPTLPPLLPAAKGPPPIPGATGLPSLPPQQAQASAGEGASEGSPEVAAAPEGMAEASAAPAEAAPASSSIHPAVLEAASAPPARNRLAYGVIGFSLVAGAAVAFTLASNGRNAPPPAAAPQGVAVAPSPGAPPAPPPVAATAIAAPAGQPTAPSNTAAAGAAAPAEPAQGAAAGSAAAAAAEGGVKVQVDSMPTGARVFRGESYLGKAPVTIARPAGDDAPIPLTLSLPGYQDRLFTLEPAAGPSVTVPLAAVDTGHRDHAHRTYRPSGPTRLRPGTGAARPAADPAREDRAPHVDVVAD